MKDDILDCARIRSVEKHRAVMDIWINSVLKNIFHISTHTRLLVKKFLFNQDYPRKILDSNLRANGIVDPELSVLESQPDAILERKFSLDSDRSSVTDRFSLNNGTKGSNNKKKSPSKHLFRMFYHSKEEDAEMRLSRHNLNKSGYRHKDYLRSNVAGTEVSGSKSPSKKSISKKLKKWFGHASKSVASDIRSQEDAALEAAIAERDKSCLLTVEVQRGQEVRPGIQVYNIYLRVTGKQYAKPVTYRTFHRYSEFKQLWKELNDINDSYTKVILEGGDTVQQYSFSAAPYANFINLITSPFPASPMKSYLGMTLNDSELSERTRMLDAWFRDVCYYYRDMPLNARTAVIQFLNFDLKANKDVLMQDQLKWGRIEQQKSHEPILIVQKSGLVHLHDGYLNELESISNADSSGRSTRHIGRTNTVKSSSNPGMSKSGSGSRINALRHPPNSSNNSTSSRSTSVREGSRKKGGGGAETATVGSDVRSLGSGGKAPSVRSAF
eukprot:CAMPEP_0174965524 /NCGR_PEP_ID=MMETSP0004_2-20121128/6480_1 /TAXON_ID=420556 /ORGANISM="Ochromonas sp., Strain CCMP1393" /LENGTH=497 /DNA_ID=CAMNT_0016214363 /DNA_START=227 /DNA_END=1720 /DNA_ORIENTATION=-